MRRAAPSSSTSGTAAREIAAAMAEQAGRLAYAHGSAFTTEPLEAYAREVAGHLPVDDPAIYPVSGGSEAIETALKLARAYHLARGETERWIVYGRWGSYHGNTLGALDLSGRRTLRRPYEGWLGRFRHVSAAYPYRADMPGANALGTADELAAELDRAFEAAGPGTVAAFVAEPIVGATLAAVVPPDGYWPADRRRLPASRRAAHRRRGHDRVRPDRALVRARPLGRPAGHPGRGQGRVVRVLAVRFRGGVGEVHDTVTGGSGLRPRLHLLARAGRRGRRARGPAHPRDRVARRGERHARASACRRLAADAFGDHPAVGEIRGRGLMVGIELVADRATREPFPRAARRHRGGRRGRARTRRPRLLVDRLRQRRRRRHDPARAAVRRHRRRARADRGGPRRSRSRRSRRRSADPASERRSAARYRMRYVDFIVGSPIGRSGPMKPLDASRSGSSPAARTCTARRRSSRSPAMRSRSSPPLDAAPGDPGPHRRPAGAALGGRRSRRPSPRRTRATACIGLIAWMHTFSPARMWIGGLQALASRSSTCTRSSTATCRGPTSTWTS